MIGVTPSPLSETLTPDRLRALSPQLRKAARFVVEHPGEVATRSQRHVASSAQLSAPTLTRLARAIGLESYDALRDQCRAEFLQHRAVLTERAEALAARRGEDPQRTGLFNDHALAAVQNLHSLIDVTDHATLGQCVQLLARARRVLLVGVMSARPVLEYVAYVASMSLGGWSLVGRDGDGAAALLADLAPDDVIIPFSIAPYAATTVALTETLARHNAPIIAVTDSRLSPLAEQADHCFCLATASGQFFPSHAAAMVFFEALIGMVIREKGEEPQRRIAAVERHNHALGEYWQD